MKWSVTYRCQNGKQAVMLVEAENRQAVFNELASKGISAIRIEVAKSVPRSLGLASLKGVAGYVVGGIVLAVAVGAIGFLMMGSGSGKAGQKTKAAKKARIETVRSNVSTNKPVEMAVEPERDPSIISVRKTINPFTGEEMMFTNRHKQVKANAGVISREALENNKHKPKRKLFKHHSENYICGLMRTPLGVPIVRGRLPKNFDDDFVKSYGEEIKIEPEDTEEDIALKQAMIDFKEEIRDQIANGASVSKIVLESREEQNKLAEYRKNLMRTIADLRREGATREELNQMREAANVMLDNKGLKRIPVADLPRKGEEEP